MMKLLGNVAENAQVFPQQFLVLEDLNYLCHLLDPFKSKMHLVFESI